MIVDVTGVWDGTFRTNALKGVAVTNSPELPLQVGDATGDERAIIFTVKLTINAQSDYANYGAPPTSPPTLISIISGNLYGIDDPLYHRTPVTGFLDDTGVVQLSFFYSYYEASTFNGRLTATRVHGDISGICVDTSRYGPATTIQQFGTLHLTKRLAPDFSGRAYLVPLGHGF